MKKYFLISSKPDDMNACNQMVVYEEEKVFKEQVYFYKEIPKKDYEILKKYLGDFYEYYNENEFFYFE